MTANGRRVRDEARAGDRAPVRRLLEDTGFFSAAEIAVALELLDDALKHREASDYRFVFVDEEDGAMSGYACFGPIPLTASSWDLYWIAVAPRHQGRGFGRLLLDHVEQRIEALGGTQIFVDTSSRAQYAPTRMFYQRHGYDVAATLEDFYAPGDGKVIYRRRI